MPFTAGGNATHALSLKDLSLIGELDKLDGITSLKIEGRMKRPEYVSAAVSAVKKAIDGEYSSSDEFMLRSVFHAAVLQTDISIPNSAKICLEQGKRKMLLQRTMF